MSECQIELMREDRVVQGVADVPVVLLFQELMHLPHRHIRWEVFSTRNTTTSIVTRPAGEAFDVVYHNIPFLLLLIRMTGTASIFRSASGMLSIVPCNTRNTIFAET